MVSPVRVWVPPLLFSRHFQVKLSALSARLQVRRLFYHNGHSLEVLREEIVEAHGGFAMHGGGDVSVGIGGLLHRGVPQHLRDELQLLPVLEHECGEGVPEVVESDVRQACLLEERLVGATVEVVAAHYCAGRGREDESQVAPESRVAQALFGLADAVLLKSFDSNREQLK